MTTTDHSKCGHQSMGGDGVLRTCDKNPGHTGWHGETVQLRDGPSTTNWGDDGKSIYASKDEQRRSGRVRA